MAISFVLLRFVPIAGAIFLIVFFGIAIGAVVGGYHYAVDVLLGAVMALVIVAAWLCHLIPNSLIAAPAVALAIGF
jgi:membrane-associated phospholipid phosphatase